MCRRVSLFVQYVQKKFENSHKEKHQKHSSTLTLEQLTACIAHMQNKQKTVGMYISRSPWTEQQIIYTNVTSTKNSERLATIVTLVTEKCAKERFTCYKRTYDMCS